jgi:hypothetical protein
VHMSVTQMNREDDSLTVFRIVGVLRAISPAWARARLPGDGPGWFRLSLVLFLLFPFLFLSGLGN